MTRRNRSPYFKKWSISTRLLTAKQHHRPTQWRRMLVDGRYRRCFTPQEIKRRQRIRAWA